MKKLAGGWCLARLARVLHLRLLLVAVLFVRWPALRLGRRGTAPLLERPAVDVLVLAAELLEQASSLRLEPVAASLGVACPGAHGARADVRMTEAILVALAPKLPDELEQLLAFQAEATRRQEEDRERFGGWLRRSRQEPGRLRLARGKRRGDFLDELAAGVTADRGYLSWVLGLADLPDEVRRVITEALR